MADDVPKTALELQIEAEAKELAEVPKIPIHKFFGAHRRCHICGQIFEAEDLKPFDAHVIPQNHPTSRSACPNCHPQRGI